MNSYSGVRGRGAEDSMVKKNKKTRNVFTQNKNIAVLYRNADLHQQHAFKIDCTLLIFLKERVT